MGNSASRDSPESSLLSVDLTSPHVKRIMEAREKLTGFERVQLIFQLNEYGEVSPELQRICTGTMMGLFVGAFLGAIGRGRIAHLNFLRSNAHEVFNSPLEAKRKLQDTVTLGMGSGAFRIGWRMALFTGMYMTTSTFTATYRGKTGMVDQVVGAGAAGFLYKFPQGPKASISGGVFGSLLGVIAGLITLGMAKLTGNSIDNANLLYYQTLAKREAKKNVAVQEAREILGKYDEGDDDRRQFSELALFHDKLIAKLDSDSNENDKKSVVVSSVSTSQDNVVVVDKSKQDNSSNNSDTSTTVDSNTKSPAELKPSENRVNVLKVSQ